MSSDDEKIRFVFDMFAAALIPQSNPNAQAHQPCTLAYMSRRPCVAHGA